MRRVDTLLLFSMLLVSLLSIPFNAREAKVSGTIYIRTDGSIDPPSTSIQTLDNITYTFSDNINGSLVIQKNDTVIDGTHYSLQGPGSGSGVTIIKGNNITIVNTEIRSFDSGIYVVNSFNISLLKNRIAENQNGLWFVPWEADEGSFNITISQNEITGNAEIGIFVDAWPISGFINISDNEVTHNGVYGIHLQQSIFTSIYRNNVTHNENGIDLWGCSNFTLFGNRVLDSRETGLWLRGGGSGVMQDNEMAGNTFNFGVSGSIEFEHSIDESNTVDGKPIIYWANRHNTTVPSYAGFVALVDSTNIVVRGLFLSNNNRGMRLVRCRNVTVKENTIANHDWYGITVSDSVNNTVSGNKITACSRGVFIHDSSMNNTVSQNTIDDADISGVEVEGSSYNTISENTILNGHGIYLDGASFNTVIRNNIASPAPSYQQGILLVRCSNNSVVDNNVRNKLDGIRLFDAHNNTIHGNTVKFSLSRNIEFEKAAQNRIYCNSFIHSTVWNQVEIHAGTGENSWDNGYPAGGNYWSTYSGVDLYSGPDQNETGGDGIGDTPQVLADGNVDRYPILTLHDCGVEVINFTKTILLQNSTLEIFAKILNHGSQGETLNVTLKLSSTIIETHEVVVDYQNATVLSMVWNSTGSPKGTYLVVVDLSPLPGEMDTYDNMFSVEVCITIGGDVDGDRDVDIFDIVRLASVYGTSAPDPRYDPNCDLDGDGDIDIFDIVIAAGNYGESW